ncbi:hypothetical protein ACIP98_07235 [Streptomyces sp. NPDC088354]|uniref:hypothetical protein n=1 Tax=unclassified Streptomyces TaxID=2593676 RepID=UPI0029A7BD78|nr:hypothetical protein [Streptomyces sp. MI02-7b]MDX3071479.1 hypothetical protein [Streptomyces sp. MI02-7b]
MPVSATDDDALFVLTAAMLTPAQFPSVLADDYPAACAELGLEAVADGYGLIFGQDGTGARWTVAVDDTALVACALAAWDCGLEYDLSPDEHSVIAALPGWPLPVAVAAPGVAAPHDPDEKEAGRPLSPPDSDHWGPAQRRMGADEIALQWRTWREQLGDPAGTGGTGGEQATEDQGAEPGPPTGGGLHPGVRRALTAAAEYVNAPPPPGRIRSTAAGEGVRTLRVDGTDWSLVARTDDVAFVLLDEEPGEVLPVGRGPELPKLLEALDKLAVRPS